MTISHIKYFLEVANCKNISEAAEHLFLSQSALGRSLSAIEKELNLQLFIRSNKGIRLTPAALVLKDEWEKLYSAYENSIELATRAGYGYSGSLKIGLLETLKVPHFMKGLLDYLESSYPNIEVIILTMSFKELLENLCHQKIDMAISLDLNFKEDEYLELINLKECIPMIMVPKSFEIHEKDELNFEDLKNIPLAVVGNDELEYGVNLIISDFENNASLKPDLFFTRTIKDASRWVEIGKKCSIMNDAFEIMDNPDVKAFPFPNASEMYVQLACLPGNNNFAVKIAKDYIIANAIPE